ncbi:hypothetical protein EGW08_001132, partial [Elysia chlorotica]
AKRVVVDPPIRDKIAPKCGIDSAMNSTTTIISVREIIRLNVKSETNRGLHMWLMTITKPKKRCRVIRISTIYCIGPPERLSRILSSALIP